MNPDELEARLERWQPADPPSELLRRLRGAEPPARTARWSWPLAYTGLAAAWMVILALWLLTPSSEFAPTPAIAQTSAAPADAPAFTNTLAMERSFLSRNNPDQL